MVFKNPLFLLFILPLIGIFIYRNRKKNSSVEYPLASFFKKSVTENIFFKYFFNVLRFSGIFFLIIALARPQKGLREKMIIKPALDIMLVLDISGSMQAIDLKPKNRLEAAKEASKEFVLNEKNNRIGLVLFAGLPFLQCPLTMDYQAVLRLIDRAEVGLIKVDGTAIGSAMALGLKYLSKSDSPTKIMVLLTDGANNAGDIDPDTATDMAKTLGVKVYTIGCGKEGPAYIPYNHPFFGRQLVKIPDELDENLLKTIAYSTGGKYFRATSSEKLKETYQEIEKMEKRKVRIHYSYEYKELFMPFLVIGTILIVLERFLKILYGVYP